MVDALSSLEKKVMDLLDSSKKLRSENIELAEKNQLLHEKIDALEMSMLKEKDDLDQEKEITKMVVDGLLKSIDSLVESENS
ncbi:MAG: cell division protein ZapB [Candidatus Babeliales bacterium]|nr:cell division protein ZapB [Candidatus Babeliales bacterium]